MKLLIAGAAGFIRSNLASCPLERSDTVIDNRDDYYNPAIKEACLVRHITSPNCARLCIDLIGHKAIADKHRRPGREAHCWHARPAKCKPAPKSVPALIHREPVSFHPAG